MRGAGPTRISAGTLLAGAALLTPQLAPAAEPTAVEFNADFLQGAGHHQVDLGRFADGNPVLPGTYLIDLDLNGQWAARLDVRFVAIPGRAAAEPCLDAAILTKLRLTAPAMSAALRSASSCANLRTLSPDAAAIFDQGALRLSISVPQALLERRPRGYVGPEAWDNGIASATLAYDASMFRSDSAGRVSTSAYIGTTAGLNLGSWHFRQRSSLSGVDGTWRFQNVAAYLQRDLPRLKSSLTIGDTFTDGAVFDSFGFRGVSLASDDRMRPESQQGYAPIIRGIAQTNARVRITQNGALLLETNVPPGPFEIDDLYPTGYGGDLLVTVLEADGRQESFAVTYAALVQLLRPKVWRYSLAAGELMRGGSGSGDRFFQAAVQHGLSNGMTLYAGTAIAPDYISGLVGAALNTPLGSIALDATLARARIDAGDPSQGYSLRLSYSKIVPGLLTNVSVAAYRHSSAGFFSMREAMEARHGGRAFVQRHKNRFQLNLSQNLGPNWGSLHLSGSLTDYWERAGSALQVQAGYSNVLGLGKFAMNYGLSYVRQHDRATGEANDRVLLTLSTALGQRANAPRLAVNLARDSAGGKVRSTGQVALSGASADGALNYNATVNLAPGANSVSLGGAYRPHFATFSVSASKGGDFTQLSLGASGGVVVHAGGVTLADQLGDTIAVVEASGARGAKLLSSSSARIDGAGFAVIPHLMPYRLNSVGIDPAGAGSDVELRSTSQEVAPRANTVVRVKFDTASGRGVMISAHLPDGGVVPFGASVRSAGQGDVGIAGQNGQIFLRGIPDVGALQVSWGDRAEDNCHLDYRLPPAARDGNAMIQIEATCRPGARSVLVRETGPRIEYLSL